MFIQLQLEQQSKEKRKSRHRRSQQQQPQSTPQPGPSGLQKVSKSRKRNAQSAQTIQIPAEAQLSLNQLLAAAGGDGASLAALAPLFGLAQPLPSTQLSQQARNQATTQPSNQPRNQPTNKPNNQPNNQTKVELTSSPSNQQKPEASSSSSKKPTDQASTSTSDAAVKDAKKPRPSIYSGTFSGKINLIRTDVKFVQPLQLVFRLTTPLDTGYPGKSKKRPKDYSTHLAWPSFSDKPATVHTTGKFTICGLKPKVFWISYWLDFRSCAVATVSWLAHQARVSRLARPSRAFLFQNRLPRIQKFQSRDYKKPIAAHWDGWKTRRTRSPHSMVSKLCFMANRGDRSNKLS